MIEYLPLVLTGIGIIVSILYYSSVLRNANKTRQAQLFSQYYLRCTTLEYQLAESNLLEVKIDTPEEFIELHGPSSDSKIWKDFLQVFGLMEGLGVLVRENLISTRMVAHSSYGDIKYVWEKYEPVIKAFREYYGWSRYGIEYEYLYNVMEKYAKEHPELNR
jgi:hypothetical protein